MESLYLTSSIPTGLKAKYLKWALCFAIPASLCLLGIPKAWGMPLFLTALALLAIGFIPYKRLCHMESHPMSLRCFANRIEISAASKKRTLLKEELRSFSMEKGRLVITLKNESLVFAYQFPKGTAERLSELYF